MSFEKDIKNILEGREKVQAVPRPDNKDRKEIENVGRPDSAEPTSDKSTYTRTAEIYRKVIEDKETTMERLSTQKLFEKVLDVIEEKKGKTEVDLNPKTNPTVMDGEDYNKKKKPMKESNSDIDKVNQVAADLKKMAKEPLKSPEKKLPHVNDPGTPDMFKITKEELKGGQKKLDKNKNGRLDSHDFKLLRKEEVEELDELDRNQGSIINRYIRKTTDDPKRKAGRDLALKKKWGDKNYGTDEPKVKAVQREEAENIEEKKVNAYAVGMAQAMKATGDEPPLEKSTINKAHKIAKAVVKREDVEFSEEEINHIANVLEASSGKDEQEKQSNRDSLKNLSTAGAKKQKEKEHEARAKEAQAKKELEMKKQQMQAQNQSYEPEGDAVIEAVKNSIQNLMKNPDAPFNGVNRGVKAKDAGLTHITDGKKK